jgi:DNA repair protein RadD
VSLQLRPYQREAIDGLYGWFAENDGNPLVVIPTAGGKSLVIATFVHEALNAWPDTRILILTHVRELISQNFMELMGFWPNAPAGIYSAGLGKRQLHTKIIFGGIQSLHSKAYALQRIDLVLVDEAHLIPRNANTMYGRFLAELRQINPYIKIIGFTATDFRLDSGRLCEGDDAVFSDVAYEANIRDLIEAGYLCPPTTDDSVAQIDTSDVGTRGGEFIAGQLEAAATDPHAIEAVASELAKHAPTRRGALIFGTGVRHCNLLADAVRAKGLTCETIFGDTPPHQRDHLIAAFKQQEIWSLCSKGVLTTGFNARHVDLIAMALATKSAGLYVQIVGRGTRLFPGKANCLVLDFGGNIARHGPVDALRVKKPGGGGGDMPLKECPVCGADNAIAARECAECGAPFPEFQSPVTTQPDKLAILTADIQPEWVDVHDVSYRRHIKPGKPDSLCVTYRCGMLWHREWVCLEHTGGARSKAVAWWQKRAPALQVPNTVDQALANVEALRKPSKLLVRPAGKYTEVMGATL